MTVFWIVWFLVGYLLAIYEMRFDMDVTVTWVICAIVFSFFGPFMLIKTLARKSSIILFKKIND